MRTLIRLTAGLISRTVIANPFLLRALSEINSRVSISNPDTPALQKELNSGGYQHFQVGRYKSIFDKALLRNDLRKHNFQKTKTIDISSLSSISGKVVVSAVSTDHDFLKMQVPPEGAQKWRFLMFTDQVLASMDNIPGPWEFVSLQQVSAETGRKATRQVKTRLPRLLPNAEEIIWIDASVAILDSSFYDSEESKEEEMMFFRHAFRDSLEDEVSACLLGGKDTKRSLNLIAREIRKFDGLEDYVLETPVFKIRPTPTVVQVFDSWSDYVSNFSIRDQLSLPLAIQKHNSSFSSFGTQWETVYNNSKFALLPHLSEKQNPLKDGPARAKTLDIVIAVKNGFDFFRDCLDSALLESQNLNVRCRIIVVDDFSSYENEIKISKLAGSEECVTVLRNSSTIGFASSLNRGLQFSDADFVLSLNSDAILSRGSLSEMLAVIASSDDIGVVGPVSNNATFQSLPDYKSKLKYRNLLPTGSSIESIQKWLETKVVGKNFLPFRSVHGFCFLMKREVIEAVGFMDEENFPNGGEEVDYCIRAERRGFKLGIAPRAFVYHRGSSSFSNKAKQNFQNSSSENLRKKWGNDTIREIVEDQKSNQSMKELRLWFSSLSSFEMPT